MVADADSRSLTELPGELAQMDLSLHAKFAANGQRARKSMQRAGVNISGDPLWTEDEENIRQHGPDHKLLVTLLPRRSLQAIKCRAFKLGLAPKRHVWSGTEIARLRKLFLDGSNEELMAAFPDVTLVAIKKAAYNNRIFRTRRPYKTTGFRPLDKVRNRCFEIRWTMVDLDRETKSGKRYFSRSRWDRG
jgi:hypothetical protein